MKSKLIVVGLAAILMIVLLFAFVVPAMSPDIDVGVAGAGVVGVMAEAADLTAVGSEAVVPAKVLSVADNVVSWTPVALAGYICMWLVLGAALLVTLQKSSRLLNLTILAGLQRKSHNIGEYTKMGGGPNKFILPVAA